jgi:hypothetical protein
VTWPWSARCLAKGVETAAPRRSFAATAAMRRRGST